MAEESKVAIRNIRRDANEQSKKAQKDNLLTEDDQKQLEDKIQKLTGGDSLKANIQLVYNNARLGAQIAGELCK